MSASIFPTTLYRETARNWFFWFCREKVPDLGVYNEVKKVSMAKAQVTVPLEIPEVRVLESEINKAGELIITVENTKETATCRRCGRVIQEFHGYT